MHHLEKWQKQYGFELDEWRLNNPEISSLFWACDRCLKKERALMADPNRQDTGAFSTPFFAYFDREKTCTDCKQHFIFSKGEQQFWYEDLGFIIFSEAKRCLPCRIKNKNPVRQEISDLVPKLDIKNLDQVQRLVSLYLQTDNIEKAKYYLAIARKANKHIGKDEKLSEIKALITQYEIEQTEV